MLCFQSRSLHCVNTFALNVSGFPPCTTWPRTDPQELPEDGTAPRRAPALPKAIRGAGAPSRGVHGPLQMGKTDSAS